MGSRLLNFTYKVVRMQGEKGSLVKKLTKSEKKGLNFQQLLVKIEKAGDISPIIIS